MQARKRGAQAARTMSAFSAFSFSSSTGLSTLYTSSLGASLLSPVPMLVTSTNFLTPFLTAALMRLMLPSLSACGSETVPPMVLTTASTSSMPAGVGCRISEEADGLEQCQAVYACVASAARCAICMQQGSWHRQVYCAPGESGSCGILSSSSEVHI
jgi:hypothetical protein